jgi:hypothetical protein
MRTNNASHRKPSVQRWVTPATAVAFGVAYLVAGWLGGDAAFAVGGLTLMVGIAAAMLLAGRFSESVAGLLDRRDERINSMDSQATAFAGMAVIAAVILGFIVEVARGEDGAPYSMLGAVGGVAYVTALVVLRFRR